MEPMTRVGLFEAKTNLSALARRVAAGEEVVVTDRGRPVMKLVPIDAGREAEGGGLALELEALRREGAAWRAAQGKPAMSVGEIVALIHEGRR
jgi:prevent-host-death family protein